MKTFLKKKLKETPFFYRRYTYFRLVGLSQLFINFLFQRIFFKHGELFFSVNYTSTVFFGKNIRFNKDSTTLISFAVSGHCYFQAVNGIHLGDNFLFAPGVKLISSNHDFKELNEAKKSPPIIIGNNVWLGANVIILPGVKIGDNCVVGAGSVVTKSFNEKGLVLVGNPAKVINRVV